MRTSAALCSVTSDNIRCRSSTDPIASTAFNKFEQRSIQALS
jgi:hypothetical protein